MTTKKKWPIYSKIWWHKLAYLYIIIVVAVIATELFASDGKAAIIRTKASKRHVISIEIADTWARKTKGLSRRSSICSDCGMLFVYKSAQKLNFWMKDTSFSLDIAFLDDNMKIIEIVRNMKPFSEETVSSTHAARYALEMPSGYFDSRGIKVHDRLLY